MTRPRGWLRVFRFWRRDIARDVDAEIAFHFEERVEDLVARGLSREDAHARATTEFGDVNEVRARLVQIDDRIAEKRTRIAWWENVMQDLRYALRGLRKSPAFTIMVATTLALGLGANAAMFSVLERLLWRQPAGVVRPQDVKRVQQSYVSGSSEPGTRSAFSYVEQAAIVAQLPPAQKLAGYRRAKMRLGSGDGGPRVGVVSVAGDYFGVLGMVPVVGRFFSVEETQPETFETVAVISHNLWIREYGGRSDAIGKPLDLGSHRYTVIGVAPQGFRGIDLDVADVWFPMSTMGTWKRRDVNWYKNRNYTAIRMVTRVPASVQVGALQAQLQRGLHDVLFTTDTTAQARLAPVIEAVWPDAGAKQLTTATRLAGVASIILFIACANVVNLLLARAVRRRREIAVRVALGVSRRRLALQLLTESMLLALIGGTAAVFIGAVGAAALRNGLIPNTEWGSNTLDYRIAAFTLLLSLITGLAVGIVPALQASRPDVITTLKAGAREGGYHRSRLRSGLIIAQATLSVILLAGAGLFVRSLHGVLNANIGYDRNQLVFASVGFDAEGDSHSAEASRRLPELAERVAGLPGVQSVGLTMIAPFNGFSWTDIYMPGGDSVPKGSAGERGPFVSYVTAGFFPSTGVHTVRGRGLSEDDRQGTASVIVVNETMARVFWPGESGVGKCLVLDEKNTPCREVVGVVSDANLTAIVEKPSMQIYVPARQWKSERFGAIVIRTAPGQTRAILPAVRKVTIDLLGSWAQPVLTVMSDELEPQLKPWRFAAMIFSCAGLLALLVAAVGIYSTVAYTMSQRTHEVGVRIALGARVPDILRLVVTSGVSMVLVGVIAGVGASLALGRVLESLLYQTSARDPVVLSAVALTLLGVAAVACFVPAWRASRVSPVVALRDG